MINVIYPRAKLFDVHGKIMTFPFIVYSAVIMDDRVIVSYSWSELEEQMLNFDENCAVWCYDLKGNILWYVEKPYYLDKITGEKVIYDQPVDEVGYNHKTNKILTYSRRGYELDPYTGKLSNDFEIR
jgi:hypothetical protein